MRYRNLTREALDKGRPAPAINPDGTWSNWPPAASEKPKKKLKGRGRRNGPGPWTIARDFQPGSGRYS